MKENAWIIPAIQKYRTICLIHRYLYYVKDSPIIADLAYDTLERKLKTLVEGFPELAAKAAFGEICPVTHPGSSFPEDYPRRVEQLAESLLAYSGRRFD
jgi:hypothetical protein